jgi:hypothetical protein
MGAFEEKEIGDGRGLVADVDVRVQESSSGSSLKKKKLVAR